MVILTPVDTGKSTVTSSFKPKDLSLSLIGVLFIGILS
jgi:hypothetical protein